MPVAVDPQHRVAGLRRPAGGGHRVLRAVRRGHDHRAGGRARGGGLQPVHGGRQRGGVGGRRRRSSCSPRPAPWSRRGSPARRPPPWSRSAAARPARPWSRPGSCRRRRTGSARGSAARPAPRRRCPVRQSRTSARITAGGRDSGVRAGYVARATAGRVGDRVAARDPRRVLGREDREAERRPGRRDLVAGLPADRRRLRAGSACVRRRRRRNRLRAAREIATTRHSAHVEPRRSGSTRKSAYAPADLKLASYVLDRY